jgi:hypothetical protein
MLGMTIGGTCQRKVKRGAPILSFPEAASLHRSMIAYATESPWSTDNELLWKRIPPAALDF